MNKKILLLLINFCSYTILISSVNKPELTSQEKIQKALLLRQLGIIIVNKSATSEKINEAIQKANFYNPDQRDIERFLTNQMPSFEKPRSIQSDEDLAAYTQYLRELYTK